MNPVLGTAVELVLLFLFSWVAIFGGLGVVLSARRGGSPLVGLVLCGIAGPFGWMVILIYGDRWGAGIALDLHDEDRDGWAAEDWSAL